MRGLRSIRELAWREVLDRKVYGFNELLTFGNWELRHLNSKDDIYSYSKESNSRNADWLLMKSKISAGLSFKYFFSLSRQRNIEAMDNINKLDEMLGESREIKEYTPVAHRTALGDVVKGQQATQQELKNAFVYLMEEKRVLFLSERDSYYIIIDMLFNLMEMIEDKGVVFEYVDTLLFINFSDNLELLKRMMAYLKTENKELHNKLYNIRKKELLDLNDNFLNTLKVFPEIKEETSEYIVQQMTLFVKKENVFKRLFRRIFSR